LGVQVVVIPIPNSKLTAEQQVQLKAGAAQLHAALGAASLRSKLDDRDNYTPGWKYNHYELKGTPLRCEFGARDLEAGTCVLVRRDTGTKETLKLVDAPARVLVGFFVSLPCGAVVRSTLARCRSTYFLPACCTPVGSARSGGFQRTRFTPPFHPQAACKMSEGKRLRIGFESFAGSRPLRMQQQYCAFTCRGWKIRYLSVELPVPPDVGKAPSESTRQR
jgi:hypothetical protein